MLNRIAEKFCELETKVEGGLICYIVAGYPDITTSQQVINAMVKGGADMIEIGIPFSDPIADGRTIQTASNVALENGMTPEKALKLARNVRRSHPNLPLLAMTYSNILVHAGMKKFMSQSKECGLDGFIIPDMPIEESEVYLRSASRLGLATVFLVSPNTPESKLRKVTSNASGFIYIVSVYGVTGARKSIEKYTLNTIRAVKRVAGKSLPIAVGFGIGTPAKAKIMINAGADAVIVGSAIIDKMSNTTKQEMLQTLEDFIKSMKNACKKK
jgi:tryptophan synthase alpha chain